MTTSLPKSYWLESDGGRVLIGHASVLLGRSPDCDIVLLDARVSRHHAIFRLTEDGVEVIPFGRQSIVVNGEVQTASATLRAGDRIECYGEAFEIVESTPSQLPEPAIQWGVERSAGALFRVARTPFRVGAARTTTSSSWGGARRCCSCIACEIRSRSRPCARAFTAAASSPWGSAFH